MVAMAVVAGGDIRGDGRLSERHGFAVISVAVVFQAVLMAFSASAVAGHFEMTVSRRFNFVSRMAIGAHGTALIAFGQQLAMDTLVVNLFHADVAFAAGGGDV